MDERLIAELGPRFVSAASVPGRERRHRRWSDAQIVGFDTEFTQDRRLLSFQLSLRAPGGELVSKVVYPDEPRIDMRRLLPVLEEWMRDLGVVAPSVGEKKKLVLVSHFALAELSMFEDAIRDFGIEQINKAHHAKWVGGEPDSWDVRVIDLFAFYKTNLAEIGALIDLPKLEVDPERLEGLLRDSREDFEKYAVRDAEIALVAFEQLREDIWRAWEIELLQVRTLAGLAAAIFRRHFFSRAAVKTKLATWVERRLTRSGWRMRTCSARGYAGEEAVRHLALRAYWGGHVEAFVRGLVQEELVEWDVVSLYPSAALLQPLPCEDTHWQPVMRDEDIAQFEGFVECSFKFPKDCMYPCLPVSREGARRLTFPRQGISFCTLAEVRAALNLGAKVRVVRGWGFIPGETEREHDLTRYMRHFLEQKRAATPGTLPYETSKLLANALIGKFAEHRRGNKLLDIEGGLRREGVVGAGAVLARSRLLGPALREEPRPGGLWVPEWAALVLGKARAIMASITARGALFVSTDAVLVPESLDMDSPGLRELRTVGSDLAAKVRGDAALIARSRLYAVMQNAHAVGADTKVYARDARWAVVRVARHGTPETKEEFSETVLACLKAGKDVAPQRERRRLAAAETAVRKGLRLNDDDVQVGQTYFRWDSKRRLVDRDVNVFRSSTATVPYLSLGKLEGAEHQRQVRSGTARRITRERSVAVLDEVAERLAAGQSVREIAAATGVPRSTVGDLRLLLTRADQRVAS